MIHPTLLRRYAVLGALLLPIAALPACGEAPNEERIETLEDKITDLEQRIEALEERVAEP